MLRRGKVSLAPAVALGSVDTKSEIVVFRATRGATTLPRGRARRDHDRVKRTATIAAAAAIALSIGTPAPAGAQAVPVQIQQCTVLQATRFPHHPFWYPYGPWYHPGVPVTDGIRIVYVNRGSIPANRVAFYVDYRGDRERIVDVGTFSPGATIDHTFGNFSGDAYLGPRPNVCTVHAVRFADGSAWRAVAL
jgi:hypothetical protein